jgi:K+-transporting ATPase ATPase B chain
VHTLLLDKTGTITLGNRQASEFIPMAGVTEASLRDARSSAPRRRTPEGRSIVVLAKQKYNIRGRELDRTMPNSCRLPRRRGCQASTSRAARFARAPRTRSRSTWPRAAASASPELTTVVERIARAGGTPLVVAERSRVLGVIHLKDIVKGGMRERFEALRTMGIKTVMITGDNPLTAAAIASEAGVDDFLAEATPEDKMTLIKQEQAAGKLVAMTGDGTNDAPALAQADVGVAMNTGTQAAKEAGNMVDLDSNPTKLIEIVEIGKQLLMTRGTLTNVFDRQRRRQVLRDHPGDVPGGVPRPRRTERDAIAEA